MHIPLTRNLTFKSKTRLRLYSYILIIILIALGSINIMHVSIVSPTNPHTGKGRDYRGTELTLFDREIPPYNGEFDFYILCSTVDFYIWKLNSCRPMQLVDSVLKPIIYSMYCIHALTLTVDRWGFSGDLIWKVAPEVGNLTEVQGQMPYITT